MGFKIDKGKNGFNPFVSCDVCWENKNLSDLNAEHDFECTRFRVVCKDCARVERKLYACWMPMDFFIYCILHNCKYDEKKAVDYQNIPI